MNIKFGDDNFYVRYLKRFLNSELAKSTTILGEFDKNDLESLVKYLNLPNVKTMFEVQREIESKFTQLNSLFNIKLGDDSISWYAKNISVEASEFLSENRDLIREYCESVGWDLTDMQEWIDISKDIDGDNVVTQKDREIIYNIIYGFKQYDKEIEIKADLDLDGEVTLKDLQLFDDYISSGKPYLTITKSTRRNYFPNKDMLVFVNQFQGIFLQGYSIRDGVGIDDMPHLDGTGLHKIALYKCYPGQKLTIAHNTNKTVHLVIGSSPATRKEDVKSLMLRNVVEVDLKPGQGFQYTCSSRELGTGTDANWLCIQCPSNYDNLSGSATKTISLQAGDINFDGKIDWLDYHLLARYTATGPGSEELKWTPTAKQLAVMNLDTENEPAGTISNKDTVRMYRYLTNDPTVMSLGVSYYTYDANTELDVDNVSNFLIIDGHYPKSVNIPFTEFLDDEWIVHDKFFNYLLDMAIQPYSNSEDITYLQKLLKEVYPEHLYDDNFFYPGIYSDVMRTLLTQYQQSLVKYTLGDLNRDNKITTEDITMLQQYLQDNADLQEIRDIVNTGAIPTPEQVERLDQNKDGRITRTDYTMLYERINKDYSDLFIERADVNQDGLINEKDLEILQDTVDGKTDELKSYQIPFILGWYDVQTEAILENEFNSSMNLSEVSK